MTEKMRELTVAEQQLLDQLRAGAEAVAVGTGAMAKLRGGQRDGRQVRVHTLDVLMFRGLVAQKQERVQMGQRLRTVTTYKAVTP